MRKSRLEAKGTPLQHGLGSSHSVQIPFFMSYSFVFISCNRSVEDMGSIQTSAMQVYLKVSVR